MQRGHQSLRWLLVHGIDRDEKKKNTVAVPETCAHAEVFSYNCRTQPGETHGTDAQHESTCYCAGGAARRLALMHDWLVESAGR